LRSVEGERDCADPDHGHGADEGRPRTGDPHEEASDDGAPEPGSHRSEEGPQRGYCEEGQNGKVLAREGEYVRAAGGFECLGLLGREAVPHPQDEGLHETGRSRADACDCPPAGFANGASRPVDCGTSVDDHYVPRLCEKRGGTAAPGLRFRKGTADAHEGTRVYLRAGS